MKASTCLGCGVRLNRRTQAQVRTRLVRHGYAPDDIEAVMPRCTDCAVHAMRRGLHRTTDTKGPST